MEQLSLLDAFSTDIFFNQLQIDDTDESASCDEEEEVVFKEDICKQSTDTLYCTNMGKSRQWLLDTLMEESTDSEEENEDIDFLLNMHHLTSAYRNTFHSDASLARYMHYSGDVITGKNKWPNHQKLVRKKQVKKKVNAENLKSSSLTHNLHASNSTKKRIYSLQKKKASGINLLRKQIWKTIVKKEIPKAYRQRLQNQTMKLASLKKASKDASKKVRGKALDSRLRARREVLIGGARRMTREAQLFWKKYLRVEKYHRKNAEKQALAQRRMNDEMREVYKQQRKLKFLITQTELYAHFVCGKLRHGLSDVVDEGWEDETETILSRLDGEDDMKEFLDDEFNKKQALTNVSTAFMQHQTKLDMFKNASNVGQGGKMHTSHVQAQPKLLCGQLTSYQLLGVNWIFNLYVHGLNGILADDMGLGKTVQTIAFLADLAERFSIWGPFLVIAPASTLNNWHQEFARFLPSFKVLPYWGTTSERKILRLFWNQKYESTNASSAPFHVLITSYQLATSDVRYFQRIQWHYIVFDEAQALKSSSSIRWKTLLEFNCRNRLLLTGTPIQNTMAELWALLHFIMPTLFDSHAEFNEWFSKNIENHVENKTSIDESDLSRLHVILKPFILRRLKRDVEHELTEKVEVRVLCQLAPRQRMLYDALQKNILLKELYRAQKYPNQSTNNIMLMNLVMQFRKVCNHPDLFHAPDTSSPFYLKRLPHVVPRLIYDTYFAPTTHKCKSFQLFYSDLNIHAPSNIQRSLSRSTNSPLAFSFLPLVELSSGEYWKIFSGGYLERLNHIIASREKMKKGFHSLSYKFGQSHWKNSELTRENECLLSETHITQSTTSRMNILLPIVKSTFGFYNHMLLAHPELIFVRQGFKFYGHLNHTVTSVQESVNIISYCKQEPCEQSKAVQCTDNAERKKPEQVTSMKYRAVTAVRINEPTELAELFTSIYLPKAFTLQHQLSCNGRSTMYNIEPSFHIINQQLKSYHLSAIASPAIRNPDRERLVMESGKMQALDMLLRRLKDGGHRVLIYSQMTKMIDILEEYMLMRRHMYVRLDGSCRISSRRDSVAGFQSCHDIFVFLLSTRAGGLGINLTAADTVIFYDSDWNPTVDQQAMDRAHRLGQTKQVTVYRLVCKGTVDERMLARAEEKSAIQRMVISDGFKTDSLNQTEMVSLLLDDENLTKATLKEESSVKTSPLLPVKRRAKRNTTTEKAPKRTKKSKIMKETSHPSDSASNFVIQNDTDRSESNVSLQSTSSPSLDVRVSSSASDVSPSTQASTEDQVIVVDDCGLDIPLRPVIPIIRGRRKRGRPRIRPVVGSRLPRLSATSAIQTSQRRWRGGSRRGRCFSGRAAAMAGARAGAVAASFHFREKVFSAVDKT